MCGCVCLVGSFVVVCDCVCVNAWARACVFSCGVVVYVCVL